MEYAFPEPAHLQGAETTFQKKPWPGSDSTNFWKP